MRRPATGGTKETLPGTARFEVISVLVSSGFSGSSLEYRTFREVMPRFFSSRRMTLQRGQTDVFDKSVISNSSG